MNLSIFSLEVDFAPLLAGSPMIFHISAAAELAPQALAFGAQTASLSQDCPAVGGALGYPKCESSIG